MWFLYSLYFALWSSIATSIIKKLTGRADPFALMFIIPLFILPFMFVIVLLTGGIPKVQPVFYPLMIASGVIDTVAFVSSFYAVKLSAISLISPISSFNPVFTAIIAFIFLNETLSPLKLLGIIVIVLGSYLLNITDIKGGLLLPFKKLFSDRGVQLFLLANFLWGVTPVFQKKAIFATSPLVPMFPAFIGALLVTLFISPFSIKRGGIKEVTKKNFGWFLLLGPFSALSQLASFTAFSLINVGIATSIFKLSTLFTILWGWLFFEEKRIKERLLGASVMIIGTILLVL